MSGPTETRWSSPPGGILRVPVNWPRHLPQCPLPKPPPRLAQTKGRTQPGAASPLAPQQRGKYLLSPGLGLGYNILDTQPHP